MLQNTIHWVKSIVIDRDLAGTRSRLDRDLAVGHYKPVNSERFMNDGHEFIFHFTPNGRTPLDRHAIGVPYQDISNVSRWKAGGGGVRCRGNTWFMPYGTIHSRECDRPQHPGDRPSPPSRALSPTPQARQVWPRHRPFYGLGEHSRRMRKLGLDFIGIEIDRGYLDEAVDRVRATRTQLRG